MDLTQNATVPSPERGEATDEAAPEQYHNYEKASAADGAFDKGITERLASPFVELRAELARDPECPLGLMNMLSKDGVAVRQGLARNPRLPRRFQLRLAEEGGAVALALLENPNLAVEMFPPLIEAARKAIVTPHRRREPDPYGYRWDSYELCARDHYLAVMGALADPRCPEELLDKYSSRSMHRLRFPRDAGLAEERKREFRYAACRGIATNPLCPPHLLDRLAVDYRHESEDYVVTHPATPTETLTWLAMYSGYEETRRDSVAAVISRGAGELRKMLLEFNSSRRQDVAYRLPEELTRELACDPDERIRYVVAATTAKADLLREMSHDDHGRVRRAATRRLLALLGM